jgi:hypothetical protein
MCVVVEVEVENHTIKAPMNSNATEYQIHTKYYHAYAEKSVLEF